VEEYLRFFASVFGTTPEEGRDLIAPIYDQIAPFRKRRADALSGGMKQKLALSCALVHRPEVLFLDEPTTGVDAVSRQEFWDLLATLQSQGLTILVSTPYMDEADRCDRVALIQKGRILGIDEPDALGRRFTLPLLAVGGPDRYRMLLALREHPHCRSVYAFGDALHFTDDRAEAGQDELARRLAGWLQDAGFADATVDPMPAGIEDVFMDLMGDTAEHA
jgi:ABC-type multidrug transport system ATPase subunit